MDRIVNNWTPQYETVKREHEELVERINATRELWPEYRREQSNLIQKQNNPMLRDVMEQSLMDDIRTFTRWHLKASEVEQRSTEALSKIDDMNTSSSATNTGQCHGHHGLRPPPRTSPDRPSGVAS